MAQVDFASFGALNHSSEQSNNSASRLRRFTQNLRRYYFRTFVLVCLLPLTVRSGNPAGRTIWLERLLCLISFLPGGFISGPKDEQM